MDLDGDRGRRALGICGHPRHRTAGAHMVEEAEQPLASSLSGHMVRACGHRVGDGLHRSLRHARAGLLALIPAGYHHPSSLCAACIRDGMGRGRCHFLGDRSTRSLGLVAPCSRFPLGRSLLSQTASGRHPKQQIPPPVPRSFSRKIMAHRPLMTRPRTPREPSSSTQNRQYRRRMKNTRTLAGRIAKNPIKSKD
ncbi:hypothetical protein GA0061100_1123 [Rhizobium hainanense]|uniref:Uncharacterized protein n=1 Tax=Rhizobium hainanense TaxID=52131 RepID=A0A1C3W5P2_9HYPH|nr:hypothetical protein GA0061100_1123 [Rhizobium hainanense]